MCQVPAVLLLPIAKPDWATGGDFEAVAKLAASRGAIIDDLNERLRAIGQYQTDGSTSGP